MLMYGSEPVALSILGSLERLSLVCIRKDP
jgi:hypothetical protein